MILKTKWSSYPKHWDLHRFHMFTVLHHRDSMKCCFSEPSLNVLVDLWAPVPQKLFEELKFAALMRLINHRPCTDSSETVRVDPPPPPPTAPPSKSS